MLGIQKLMTRGGRKGGTASARGLKTAESSDIAIEFTDKMIRVRFKPEGDETEATQKSAPKPSERKKPN